MVCGDWQSGMLWHAYPLVWSPPPLPAICFSYFTCVFLLCTQIFIFQNLTMYQPCISLSLALGILLNQVPASLVRFSPLTSHPCCHSVRRQECPSASFLVDGFSWSKYSVKIKASQIFHFLTLFSITSFYLLISSLEPTCKSVFSCYYFFKQRMGSKFRSNAADRYPLRTHRFLFFLIF